MFARLFPCLFLVALCSCTAELMNFQRESSASAEGHGSPEGPVEPQDAPDGGPEAGEANAQVEDSGPDAFEVLDADVDGGGFNS